MSPDLIGKIFALLCAIIWAIAVILFKKSGEKLSPMSLTLYKTIIAIILIFPLIFLENITNNISILSLSEYLPLIASGILGIAIADSLFFKSLNMIGAGLTAIVDCVYSPITMFLSFLFLSEKITLSMIFGSILVATAVLIGAYQKDNNNLEIKHTIIGIIYGITGIILMVISVILMKPILAKTSIFFVTEIRMITGLFGIIILILFRKNRKKLFKSAFKKSNFKYALPASILGNVIAMSLWVAAFKLTDINSATILNQTNTIFIIILASLFLNEKFTSRKFISLFLALSGTIIVLLS